MSWIKERIKEIKNIKSGKKELREYTLTVGIIYLIILTVAVLWKHIDVSPNLFLGGAAFIVLGLSFPVLYKPFHKIWMSSGIILGFFVSRLVLTILFYFVMAPMGLIARLLRKDLLSQKIDKNVTSYWRDRGPVETKASYENQY